jgi:hypothetical protein
LINIIALRTFIFYKMTVDENGYHVYPTADSDRFMVNASQNVQSAPEWIRDTLTFKQAVKAGGLKEIPAEVAEFLKQSPSATAPKPSGWNAIEEMKAQGLQGA